MVALQKLLFIARAKTVEQFKERGGLLYGFFNFTKRTLEVFSCFMPYYGLFFHVISVSVISGGDHPCVHYFL